MEKAFNEAHPKYKDYYKVFIFGDKAGRKDKNGAIVQLGGFAKRIVSKSVCVFDGKTSPTVTHELFHAMSLYHTFEENKGGYSYKKGVTLNIMDYSHLTKYGNKKRILTWLWQWKKLWNKLPKE